MKRAFLGVCAAVVLAVACGNATTSDETPADASLDASFDAELSDGAARGADGASEGSTNLDAAAGSDAAIRIPATGTDVDQGGTRLIPHWLRADGLQQQVGWTDTTLHQACALQTVGVSGQQGCLPSVELSTVMQYSASDCNTSSALAKRDVVMAATSIMGLCETATYSLSSGYGSLPSIPTCTAYGAFYNSVSCWSRQGLGPCEVDPFQSDCNPMTQLGAVVALSTFATGTAAVEAKSPLGLDRLAFPDGTKSFKSWNDGIGDCAAGLAPDGTTHCFEASQLKGYLDNACKTPVYVAGSPHLNVVDACGVTSPFTAVPLTTAFPKIPANSYLELYQLHQGQCQQGDVTGPASVLSTPGDPLPLSAIPTLQPASLTGPRLRADYEQASGFKQFTSFFDQQLGAHCTFYDFADAAVGLRCVPSDRVLPDTPPITAFRDAACTQVLQVVPKPAAAAACGTAADALFVGAVSTLEGCYVHADYRALDPAPASLFVLTNGTCGAASGNYYVVGAALDPTSLVQGEIDP
ncbi:MAG: hypothetical protein ABI183_13225 [Polyangiaceae bacterium]